MINYIYIIVFFLLGIFSSQAIAGGKQCLFPDIPAFANGQRLSNGIKAELSFSDYRTYAPDKGRFLLDCAQTLFRNANKAALDKKAATRLSRTMALAWTGRNTEPSTQVDGYTVLGACADGPCNAYMGTMILNPARKLVAIGLTLNDTDQIDEDAYADYLHANFVFIRDTGEKNLADGKILNLILAEINKNYSGFYLFDKIYIIDSHLN